MKVLVNKELLGQVLNIFTRNLFQVMGYLGLYLGFPQTIKRTGKKVNLLKFILKLT